jgi:hypothetical protein
MLAASQTTASWVADLRPGAVQHWATATSSPCTGLFKPVRVDERLDLGSTPTDRFDERALWWRHECLHRAVMRNPAVLMPLFVGERDHLEREWLDGPPPAAEAFVEADCRLDEWTRRVLAHPASDIRPSFVRRYWGKRDLRAGIPATKTTAQRAAAAV